MDDEIKKEDTQDKADRPTFIALCGRAFRSDPEFFPQVEYRGRRLYLCTSICLDAFLADPDRFYVSHRKKYVKKESE